jgi:superfamily I DNA/RNA helicase/mRNA-degrading endonuclease RelE of RelBE toxin-antitoxin system
MEYAIQLTDSFQSELDNAPKKVKGKIVADVFKLLRAHPDNSQSSNIKKLKGWKFLWRYRIDDWRLVYALKQEDRTATLLMLGHRKNVYDRLGHDDNGPTAKVISNKELEHYLEAEVTPRMRSEASLAYSLSEVESGEPTGSLSEMLPRDVSSEVLHDLDIPSIYHSLFLQIRTVDQLLDLQAKVPGRLIERMMNYFWPSTIERIVQTPVRVVTSVAEYEALSNGEITLESLLLKLDDDQRAFVARFENGLPNGPWMIKGGPGSGKSTVALHCIRGLLQQGHGALDLGTNSVKILFTTYTKSLVLSANHLFSTFKLENQPCLDTYNIDKVVHSMLPSEWKNKTLTKDNDVEQMIADITRRYLHKDSSFPFSEADTTFLREEIEWVIIGEDIENESDYLTVDRRGRGRRLDQRQRRSLWKIYQELTNLLRDSKQCLWSQRYRIAALHSRQVYDYIFIDEAQDLKPVALRFILGLVRDPKNVFLMADSNQTIYNGSTAWQKASDDLNFRGRSRVLRKNYRTTFETWQAITPIAESSPDIDLETLEAEPVFHGPVPALAWYSTVEDEATVISNWMLKSLLKEKISRSGGAILCPTNKECMRIAKWIDPVLNARYFKSGEFDLSHDGVKVMTMHAAKGLQFPIVAVTGLEDGLFPENEHGGVDRDENIQKQKRVFFVACSRAMRHLLVCVNRNRPSQFIDLLNRDHWEIHDTWE